MRHAPRARARLGRPGTRRSRRCRPVRGAPRRHPAPAGGSESRVSGRRAVAYRIRSMGWASGAAGRRPQAPSPAALAERSRRRAWRRQTPCARPRPAPPPSQRDVGTLSSAWRRRAGLSPGRRSGRGRPVPAPTRRRCSRTTWPAWQRGAWRVGGRINNHRARKTSFEAVCRKKHSGEIAMRACRPIGAS
jgi:hypothetical protein